MLVETEVTDIPPAQILKEKRISLTLHMFKPGAEEQPGTVQPAGMPKAAAGDPKPANLKAATMDTCSCRAPVKISTFSGL